MTDDASAGWAGVYDALAPTYDALLSDGWRANDVVGDLLRPLALGPVDVLDLGAGTGRTALMLRGLYPGVALTMVDPSQRMLDLARGRVPDAEAVVADAASFLRDDTRTWDIVAVVGVLELVPDLFEVLTLAARRLRPGGHLAASHEPLIADGSVQSQPVSTLSQGQQVHRHPRGVVEEHAAGLGLVRVASCDAVAFCRGDDGEALDEFVVWRLPGEPTQSAR